MATLPTDESLGFAAPDPGSGRRTVIPDADAVDQAVATLGQQGERTGLSLIDKAQQQQQANTDLQMAGASSSLLRTQLDLEQKYQNDPDYQTMPGRYAADLGKAKLAALGAITDPKAKLKFGFAADDVIARSVFDMKNTAIAKQKDATAGYTTTLLDSNLQAATNTKDPHAQMALLDASLAALDAGQKQGVYSAEQGAAEKIKYKTDFAKSVLGSMQTPDLVRALGGNPDAPIAPTAGGTGATLSGPPPSPSDGTARPGVLHVDPALAPRVPAGAPRPFGMGEYVENPDGSTSNEITITVENPKLNGGKPTVLPSLWLVNGKPITVNEDVGARYALQSGLTFPSFANETDADKFTTAREATWQGIAPQDAGKVAPLWKQGSAAGGDAAARTRQIESSGNYEAKGGGAYQVHDGPVNENSLPAEQDAFFASEFPKRGADLSANLGRPIDPGENYLAWQQGTAGATKLLQNPDAKASDLVGLAAVRDNLPDAMKPQASTMLAGDFSKYWVSKYDQTGGGTTAGGTQVASLGATDAGGTAPAAQGQPSELAALLPKDDQQALLNSAYARDEHAAMVAAKQQDIATKQATTSVIQQLLAHDQDPTKPDVDMAAVSKDPIFASDPEALKGLASFQRALDRPDPVPASQSALATQQLFRRMDPSYQGADKITSMDQVNAAFAPSDGSKGVINRSDRDWLQTQFTNAKDASGQQFLTTANEFFKSADKQIDPAGGLLGAGHSPFAAGRSYAFKQAVMAKVADMRAKGEDPAILFNPDPSNKLYVGQPGFMHPYTRSMQDINAEAMGQSGETPPEPVDTTAGATLQPVAPAAAPVEYKSLDDLQRAIDARQISYDAAQQYALTHNLAQKYPPKPTAPAATGPTVPSGE